MTKLLIKDVHVFDSNVIQAAGNVAFTRSAGNLHNMMADTSDIEASDQVIDGHGCTLIPGLIDVYVNIKGVNAALGTFANHGVTTVIDLSSSTEQCQSMRVYAAGKTGLPTVLTSGTGAATTTTEDHQLQLENDPATAVIRTREDAVAFVSAKSSGPDRADFVKVLVTLQSHTDEILKTIVDIAHIHKKLTVARTMGKASYERAMRAGFDIFAHAPLDAPIDAATAQEMAAQSKIFIPTLAMMKKHASSGREASITTRVAADQRPSPNFISDTRNLERGNMVPGATVGTNYANATESVRTLHQAGVTICAGTTANLVPGAQMPFGESLHEELRLLVDAGMPTLDVLRSATCVASKAFDLGDRGFLRVGFRADLVLVEGNPLEDISATQNVKGIWIQGEYIGP
ncbi:amidohydrolase [Colletotrichum orchidophilum]|uniref:Amidohydrolase n=1 Tax=Colletotrichum orchidophilum TaxID=1209926 RepID=A0A1G4BA03_9PEZI|nr:amidohydrolase [Colletotrichum orchidophilum]OHE98233.1 amidohydrolase [Colletotrichum orchidophilum]